MMIRLAAALIITPSLAGAAETELASRIDRVTVYPYGAVVTRLGRADLLPGASRIALRGLPATVDPASIRVDAGRRVAELRNFLMHRVQPHASARGPGLIPWGFNSEPPRHPGQAAKPRRSGIQDHDIGRCSWIPGSAALRPG